MPHPAPTRELFLDYLLGKLSPEQREQVDDALLEDQDFSSTFKEIEYQLLDDLASKALPYAENLRVEDALSKLPHLHDAVRMASAFRRATRPTPPLATRNPSPVPVKRSWWFSPLALCSALALLLLCFFVSVRQMHTRSNIATGLSASHRSAEGPAKSLSTTSAASQQAERSVISDAARAGNAPKQAQPARREDRQLVSVLLLPELVRGQQKLSLNLPGSTTRFDVQFHAANGSASESYTLEATNLDSAEAYHGQRNRDLTVRGQKIVVFSFDARGFSDGEYEFKLGKPDGVFTYSVSVKRIASRESKEY